nr:hypothetical protein [Moraxella sp. HMSC061H09]
MALILNLLINILVLGFFLDYDLLVAYAVGFLLVEFFIFYHKNQISKMSKISQKSRIYFIAILNKIWDNVIIFNQYNVGIFNRIYKKNFNRSKKYHIHSQSFNQLISSFGMILFMIPVLGLIVYLSNTTMIMYFYHCWLQHYQDKYSYCKWDRYLFSTKPIFLALKPDLLVCKIR